ncbi:hypothetical protein IG193_02175 [Infirmifilum lucidum]|uniref:FtsX-like permease family protein n=1 Tax=Infirmifilum lucidum TaxID=2776706 RepID=A0A7L9FIW3_9CREN|nr:hypothetical protein [Infirmifilum lucidum]QOJ79292.1 hypothetical protein IG193_02175 [Infirmifilum lucidum]
MSCWGRVLRSSLLLARVCLRGEVLRITLLVVSLPLTLSSIYIVGSSALVHELSFVATAGLHYAPREAGCVWARVVYLNVNEVRAVPVYLVEDLNVFLSLYGCRATYARGERSGALVSAELWVPGFIAELSLNRGIFNASAVGFVECRYLKGGFIVVNASRGVGWVKLCPRHSTQLEVVSDFGESFSGAMLLLAFLSLLPFAAVSPLTLSRAVESLSRELCVLRGQGLGVDELKCSLSLSLAAVALLSSAYGVAAGVVLAHGALWALRFFGVTVFSRPLPLSSLLLPSGVYAAVLLLLVPLVVQSRVGELENTC